MCYNWPTGDLLIDFHGDTFAPNRPTSGSEEEQGADPDVGRFCLQAAAAAGNTSEILGLRTYKSDMFYTGSKPLGPRRSETNRWSANPTHSFMR